MDSFTDDLSSPLPKQTHGPLPETQPRSPTTASTATERRSETQRRRASPVTLRPLSDRLGRVTLKQTLKKPIASPDTKQAPDDPFKQLSDDMLEHILARLPLFPLKAAKKVCKRWATVSSTPEFDILQKEVGEQQPLLVCYGANHLVPARSMAAAYDIESEAWLTLPGLDFPSHNGGSLAGASGAVFAIAGPDENRLRYKLAGSVSSVAEFGETWVEAPAMRFPRSAPVVSVARGSGWHKLVVAGGVPQFEDEHMAVELFDSRTGAWEHIGDLPADFCNHSSRTWMSGVLCTNNKFFASLNFSWPIHVLDAQTKSWSSLQLHRPDGMISHTLLVIGTTLVVAGLCAGDSYDRRDESVIRLWKVDPSSPCLVQIGLMPGSVLATATMPSLKYLVNENLVYVSLGDGNVVVGEVSVEEGKTRWWALPKLSALGCRFDCVVTFCASIGVR